MSIRIIEDESLHIDPREHIIEHYGHGSIYSTHRCPKCEQEIPCKAYLCKLDFTIECLPCAQRQLLEDTERFSKEASRFAQEARQFIATALPTDDQTLMWWRALRSEVDGHLKEVDGKMKGLAESAREIQRRINSEVKA